MAALTPDQLALRKRIEGLIAAASPALDLLLGVGDLISRIAEPVDHEHYPVRAGERVPLPGEPGWDRDQLE